MFLERVSNTPFTQNVSGTEYEKRVRQIGTSPQGDNSFVSTLRAMLPRRMTEDDVINVCFVQKTSSTSPEAYAESVAATVAQGSFAICDYRGPKRGEEFESMCNTISATTGSERVEKITQFYGKSFDVACLVNHTLKSVILIVPALTLRKLHYVQCAIPVMLPWYFSGDNKGLSDSEKELIRALGSESCGAYMACLAKISDEIGLRDMFIRGALTEIETKTLRDQLEKCKVVIGDIRDRIKKNSEELRSLLEEKETEDVRYAGLMHSVKSGSIEHSELIDFIMNNKDHIILEGVEDNTLILTFTGYLDSFSEEIAEEYIMNTNCDSLYGISSGWSNEDLYKLLKAAFVDKTIKIRSQAGFEITVGRGFEAIVRHDEHDCSSQYDTFFQNPHIYQYGCTGGYRPMINSEITNGNTIGAMMVCAASCNSLSFGDSTVLEEFVHAITGDNAGYNQRVIELQDGSIVTPGEALVWINEQEKKGE